MRHLVLSAALTAAATFPARAIEFGIETPDQAAFAAVSEDLLAAYGYKALQPAEATGLTGFAFGAFASYTPVDDEQAWQTLTGEDISELGMVGATAHKGLPLGLDLGAFYATVPGADASLWGAELRWAAWEGGIASPALALRGAYTTATGIDDFDFSTYSIDVTVSKGFAFATPYAGVGYVWGAVDPADDIPLEKEEPGDTRLYAGLRLSTLLFEITPEYERVGDHNAFNLRLGFSF